MFRANAQYKLISQSIVRFVSSFPGKMIWSAVAGVAAVGAVLSGLAGYWTTYNAIKYSPTNSVPDQQQPKQQIVASAPLLSIAVIPFTGIGGNPEHDFFAESLAESISQSLSLRVSGLRVAGKGSTLTYKGKAVSPRDIGRELGVRYVLQGSVQHSSQKLRVNAYMTESDSGLQKWADQFETDATDYFKIQDELTSRVANSLSLAIIVAGVQDAERRSANPLASDMVMRAESALRLGNRSFASYNSAEEFYRKALAIEPENPTALIGLGSVLATRLYNFRRVQGMSASEIVSQSRTALDLLDRGLASAPSSALAHDSRGLLFGIEQRWREAIQEFESARSIDPSFVQVYNNLANALNAIGKPELAIDCIKEAIRRSPREPQMGIWLLSLGLSNVLLQRWDEAIDATLKASSSLKGYLNVQLLLASSYAHKGDLESASKAISEALLLRADLSMTSLLANPFSNDPQFASLAGQTLYSGLRKAGLPENPPDAHRPAAP